MCIDKIKPHEILPVINDKNGMIGYEITAAERERVVLIYPKITALYV